MVTVQYYRQHPQSSIYFVHLKKKKEVVFQSWLCFITSRKKLLDYVYINTLKVVALVIVWKEKNDLFFSPPVTELHLELVFLFILIYTLLTFTVGETDKSFLIWYLCACTHTHTHTSMAYCLPGSDQKVIAHAHTHPPHTVFHPLLQQGVCNRWVSDSSVQNVFTYIRNRHFVLELQHSDMN